MHIVQLIDSLRSGGKERQLVELLKGLVREDGIECELIVMSNADHYTDVHKLGIPVHRLVRKNQRDPAIFWKLYKLLKIIQPDILHSWSSMCSIYALPAVKLLDIKFVNGFLRSAPPSLNFQDKEWRRVKLTFPFSDAIVANSKAGLKAYRAPENKSFCIYNGFDQSRLQNLKPKDEVRQDYKITTPYVVGMVATFSDNKDFATFINAAQMILETRQDLTFVAVGDGPNRLSCQQMVEEKNRPFILFPGKLQDVESLVQVFDIGVLVSNAAVHGEGISNTIMEYMALGKPVIATDCGGNRELVVDGETGFIVNDRSVDELAEKILLFLNDNAMCETFGKANIDRLNGVFTLSNLTSDHVKLYQDLNVQDECYGKC